MTTMEERQNILQFIDEACEKGIPLQRIYGFLEISGRTVQRWRQQTGGDRRKGSQRNVPSKLSDEEKETIIETANLPEYRGLNPAEIVAILGEKGIYLASERSFYRVLKEYGQLAYRGPGKRPVKRERASHEVNGPMQLLSWDITYLKTNINGIFFYLYLFMDVWSRKIVEWEIHSEESSELSAAIMERMSKRVDLKGVILHADNGGPMKGSTMLMKMYDLGVTASFSRPRVSEDNPYSESLFKTLKYRPSYPGSFNSLSDARKWIADFVHWYNHEHRHSGIGYVTPEQRHSGQDRAILKNRTETFRKAREAHPERWSGHSKVWNYIDSVTLGARKCA